MPVKNAESYLSDCLNSILGQEFNNWELIAVNDDSSDGSLDLLTRFSVDDRRIKVLQNSGQGIIEALQTAYAASSGELIHRMDADDKMPPLKLRRMTEAWERGTVITGKVEYFSDEWMVGLGFQSYQRWINGLMDKGHLWDEVYMECPIPSPAWLLHRSDLDRIGAFDSRLLPEDYDLCFRMYEAGIKVKTVKETLHLWRDSQNRTSRKDPAYFPMAYYPLKLHYFLKLDRAVDRPLFLWGAGKKGKLLARLLKASGVAFRWITDNEKKIGVDIYDIAVEAVDRTQLSKGQTILAVASPEDKQSIKASLKEWDSVVAKDHWWFC